MTFLDFFALLILLVLFASAIACWVLLGMCPGKIARQRNHPQAEAIAVCGWWGVITLGLLLPIAWIWAYTKPSQALTQTGDHDSAGSSTRQQTETGKSS